MSSSEQAYKGAGVAARSSSAPQAGASKGSATESSTGSKTGSNTAPNAGSNTGSSAGSSTGSKTAPTTGSNTGSATAASKGSPAAPAVTAATTTTRPIDTGKQKTAGVRPSPSSTARPGAPRRVRLTVSRVDPWSVMKLSFLLSVAIGIALVVASGVLWTLLEGMGIFGDVNGVVGEVLGDATFDVDDYVGFGKVVSFATVIAVADVVLMTAIATLGAFLYNIAGSLVGGLHVTLTDD